MYVCVCVCVCVCVSPWQIQYAGFHGHQLCASETSFHGNPIPLPPFPPNIITEKLNWSDRRWLLAPGSWLLAPGSWLLAPGSWLLAPGSWLLSRLLGSARLGSAVSGQEGNLIEPCGIQWKPPLICELFSVRSAFCLFMIGSCLQGSLETRQGNP